MARIRNIKSGLESVTGGMSISSKLTKVLDAFNKCAAQTKIMIDSVSITTRNIIITGSTTNRQTTLLLFDTIKKNSLDVVQTSLSSENERDKFRITVIPKQ